MKIANVVCTYPPYKGGMGNSAKDFSEILSANEHQVTTFTPEYTSPQSPLPARNALVAGGLIRRGVPSVARWGEVIRLKPLIKYGNGACLPQLFFKLKNFDAIYLHYPFFGTAEIVWLYKLLHPKAKLIIHFHMDVIGLSPLAKILSFPSRLIRDSLFKQANIITCASLDYVKHSSITSLYKKYPDKFKEVPFSVDTAKFKPSLSPTTRTSWGKEIRNILFVGGLDKAHYFKGLNILLQALKKLKSTSWKLNIVGSGNLKPEYEKQVKDLNLKNNVNFLGSVSNEKLPSIYQQADFLVLPSTTKAEAFGLVLIEAMACGVPVIASNLPGVRSVFQDGVQGLLTKPSDINDLKEKIQQLLKDNNQRKRMGKEARILAQKKYSQKNISKKLIDLFNQYS